MAGTAVTDEWVNTHFEEGTKKLKNGLYIIFRVEGINGFILKHYGVTDGNGDKLDLDNPGIVKSKSLEETETETETKTKIASTMLKLGKEENSTLSGMGFVKKDDGIRAFVDVTDGTDPNTIRKRLDNESTINNFFNHNIYDWFIKKKIREHIRDAHGDDNVYEDDFECDITEIKEAYKVEIDNQLIKVLDSLLENANVDDFGSILNTFITNNTENKNLINKIVDIFKIIQKKNSKNILDVTKPSPNIGENADKLKDINEKIKQSKGSPYEEAFNNLEKNNIRDILTNLDLHNSTNDTEIQEKIIELQNTLISDSNIDIEKLDTAQEDEIDMSTIQNDYKIKLGGGYIEGKEAIDYNDDIHITLDNPSKKIEENIEKITTLFNGEFRYILSLHTSYKTNNGGTFVTYWRQWITTLQKKLNSISIDKLYEDLLPFLFVDASYQNKMRKKMSGHANVEKYQQKFTLMNESKNGIIDLHPYYTNNANHLIKEFFQVAKNVEMSGVTGLENIVSKMKVIHIADLIQIYNRMKKYTQYVKRGNNDISYKFETITKSIANYFRDLGEGSVTSGKSGEDGESGGSGEDGESVKSEGSEGSVKSVTKNVWWENIDKINNLCQAVNTQLGLKQNINLINDSKLMTFVKINNYSSYNNELALKRWNLTYTPYISKKNNSFLKLTVKNYDSSTTTNEKKNFKFPTNIAQQVDSRTYIFGGFSHVFKPNQADVENNEDDQVDEIKEMIDTDQTTNIIKKITQTPNPEKVFIFGYGASGAGKTAMLVYNNKKKKDGYCIHLCKEIAKEILKKNNNGGTVTLTLNIHEFDKDYRHKSGDTYFNTKEFTYTPGSMKGGENKEMGSLIDSRAQSKPFQKGGGLSKAEDKRLRMDPYSVYNSTSYQSEAKSIIDKKIKEEFNSNEFIDSDNIPLVFYIREYVTDESKSGKRKIKPTRNNDQSSRSHVIIFLDFKYNNGTDTDYGSLIIADLAGVENPFDPFDPDTIIETRIKIKSEIEKMEDKELEENIYNVKSSISLKGTKESRDALKKYFTTDEYTPDLNVISGEIKFTDYTAEVDIYEFDDNILKPEMNNTNVDLSKHDNVNMIYEIIKNEHGNGYLDSYFDKVEKDISNKKSDEQLVDRIYDLNNEVIQLTNTINSEIGGSRKDWVNYLKKFKELSNILSQKYDGASTDQWEVNSPPKKSYNRNTPDPKPSKDTIWPQSLNNKWNKVNEETHYKNKINLEQKTIQLENLKTQFAGQSNVQNSALENDLYHFYYGNNTQYHAQSNISPQKDKLFYFYYKNKGYSNILSFNISVPEYIGKIKSFLNIQDDIEPTIIISQNPNTLGQININWSYLLTQGKRAEYQKKFLGDFAEKNTEILNTLEYEKTSSNDGTNMSKFITDKIFTETNYEDKETAEHYRNEVIKFCKKIPKHSKFDQDKQNKIRKRKQYELQYIMNEVGERYEEGLYINDQLKLLRKNMFDAMYHKCDGFLFTAPNINETCASSLCVPTDNKTNNCYLMETKKITDVVGKNGITDIFVKMQSTYNYSNTSEMLKNLNILVFTVFNITEKDKKVDDNGIQNPFNDDTNNKLYSYLEPTQFIDIEKITEPTYLGKIKDMFTNNSNKNSQHTSVKESAIRDELKKDISSREYPNIIEKLNTHNASTPLGTLFFTDNMSKFGKNNICHTQDSKDDFNFVLDYVYESEDRKNAFKRTIEGSDSKTNSNSNSDIKDGGENESDDK